MKKLKTFLAAFGLIIWRILLVPLGLSVFALGFFDDRGGGLLYLADRLSNATHLPQAIYALILLAIWIVAKGALYMTGVCVMIKSVAWKTPFWEIWNSISAEPKPAR